MPPYCDKGLRGNKGVYLNLISRPTFSTHNGIHRHESEPHHWFANISVVRTTEDIVGLGFNSFDGAHRILRMSIREPLKKDAMEMAQVLYAGLRPLRMFPVLWPGAQRDNWIEVQADYCVQHLEENHSVAFVTVNEKATTTGIAYARFLRG